MSGDHPTIEELAGLRAEQDQTDVARALAQPMVRRFRNDPIFHAIVLWMVQAMQKCDPPITGNDIMEAVIYAEAIVAENKLRDCIERLRS
jgi:hypothetical protein